MRALMMLFGLLLIAGGQARANPVPADLEAWRDWVLKEQDFRRCPLIAGRKVEGQQDFACLWPGTLRIEADVKGARIEQQWRVESPGWLPLPGDHTVWPQQVSLDGKPAVVLDQNGPAVWAEAGTHQLRASLNWVDRPQAIRVSALVALVDLKVDGKPVLPLQRTGDMLTLGRGKTEALEADRIDVRVFRRYTDAIPGILETRVIIDASGQAREEILGPALPAGFVPLAVNADAWPVRLDEAGRLHVQVQAGSDTITLLARAEQHLDTLTASVPKDWATQEVWSYEAQPQLRVTRITGALQVDPKQSNVPGDWASLPAFALSDGDQLKIEQRTRGLDVSPANRLNLTREAWLDFSGEGWFARDRIQGNMAGGWRFDMARPFELQRAQDRTDDNEPLLITRGNAAGLSGVEWRNANVDLSAAARVQDSGGSLPVSGWNQTFDQVDTLLHLPHGYRLIAAPGSDRASGSWLSRWTLLDAFLAAITVLLAARLCGWAGGVASAGYLLLAYQEPGSPLWTLLLALVLGLLARLMPAGRLAKVTAFARTAALVLLACIALPFAATQVRTALYPQLETNSAALGIDLFSDNEVEATPQSYGIAAEMAMSSPVPASPAPEEQRQRAVKADKLLNSIMVTGSKISPNQYKYERLQSNVVQTGGGEPGWQLGQRYRLSWSGPVLPDQTVRLLIASPWLVRLLRVVMVGLLGWLLWSLLRNRRAPSTSRRPLAAIGMLAFGLGTGLGTPTPVQAQNYPPAELLAELKARLTEAPRCAPQCGSIALAEVSARDDRLSVALEVHAQEALAVPVPFDASAGSRTEVRIDGRSVDALMQSSDRHWVAVGRGVHRVEILQTLIADRVALVFPLAPERVLFDGVGWQANGLADARLLTETLSLARAREEGGQSLEAAQQFPPYVIVQRQLNLAVEWRVDSTVTRVAPEEDGFTVKLPVLAGEHVATAGLNVQAGELTIGLGEGEDEARWASTLERGETLSLTAPELGRRAEVWRLAVGQDWHVEFSGVPESAVPDQGDFHVYEFHPLPGETLNVRVLKPTPIEGATRAVDRLNLATAIGEHARTHTLGFNIRSSQGGEHSISLPPEAELLGVTRNGQELGARLLEGKLSLPLDPGDQQFEIRFREHGDLQWKMATPEVGIGLPAANLDLAVDVPHDRWLLAAFGPPVGPAVLFWGELVVAIVLAWLLARWRKGSLRFHHWLLLVLGFSTFSWLALLVVVGWLLALEWRGRTAPERNWIFNLAQLGLALLSLIALVCLFESIRNGLLGSPDMVIRGNGSSAGTLRWFADRSEAGIPQASVFSLPLWIYNLVMLTWALWLAWAVVGWLRAGFKAWIDGGHWRPWREPAAIEIDLANPPPPA